MLLADDLAQRMAEAKQARFPSAHCNVCPLADRPLVPSLLVEDAKIMVVGEAPGNEEVTQERPFIGESGYILERSLEQVTDYNQVALTNTVLCHPENNDKPGYKAMLACRDRLLEEIQACNPKVIVAAGGAAIVSLEKNDKLRITKERGKRRAYRIGDDEYQMVPTFHPAFLHRQPGAWTDFAHDLEQAARVANGEPEQEHVLPRVHVSATTDETNTFLQWAHENVYDLAVDIETASKLNQIRFGEDKIISVAFSWDDGEDAFVVPFDHFLERDVSDTFVRMLGDKSLDWIYQNGKFDTKHLTAYFGVEVPLNRDTLIAHYCLDERKGTHDLKQRASEDLGAPDYEKPLKDWLRTEKVRRRRHNSIVRKELRRRERFVKGVLEIAEGSPSVREGSGRKKKIKEYVPLFKEDNSPYVEGDLLSEDLTYDDVPKDMLYLYQGYDVAYTMRLDRLYMPRIQEQGLRPLFDFLMRAGRALAKMEMHGVLIDVAYRETLKDGLQADMDILMRAMQEYGGEDFDPDSPKKLSHVLFSEQEDGGLGLAPPPRTKRTVHGWSTAKDVLEQIEAQHPIIEYLLAYRGLTKLHGSYVVRLERFLYKDGRIRPDYRQHGTVTGRMSEPIMTWPKPDPKRPKKPHIRNLAITPQDGPFGPTVFLEGDAAAGELRVMACLSGEPLWVRAFNEGRDIHNEVMLELGFGGLEDAIAEMDGDAALGEKLYDKKRRDIKVVNFGVAYGMEEHLLSMILKWPVWQAKQFLKDYWQKHSTLYEWLEEVKEEALTTGRLTTPFGRIRRYGLITRPVVKAVRNEAGNFKPQSILSDTMLWATSALVEEYWDQGVRPILFVHDAAGIETPISLVEPVARRFREIVADVFRTVVWPVAKAHVEMDTDYKVGRSWGQARKWNVGQEIIL